MSDELFTAVRAEYTALTEKLIETGLTVTTMESCTGGLIASLITDTVGASAVMKGAYVTYSNEAKIMNGVPEKTIADFGVYSGETAAAMASACRENYHADIGIGVTGSMVRADPGNRGSIPGEIYYALDFRGEIFRGRMACAEGLSRAECKLTAARAIGAVLTEMIEANGF